MADVCPEGVAPCAVRRVSARANAAPGRGAGRSPRNVSQQGFTMTEVLVTMVLLTMVLVGLTALQLATIRNVSTSKASGEATRLAQRVINRYDTMTLARIAALGNATAWVFEQNAAGQNMTLVDGEGRLAGDAGSNGGPYSVQVMRERLASASPSILITVRVSWTSNTHNLSGAAANGQAVSNGRQYSITLATERF